MDALIPMIDLARLRDLRIAAGLSQSELAERAGLSYSAISLIESGKRINVRYSTILALTKALESIKAEQ